MRNPLIYVFCFMFIYTGYDYWDHISRPDSLYEQYSSDWLLFTLVAFTSFVLLFLALKKTLELVFKQSSLVFEVIALAGWLTLYIQFIGPVIDYVFWPHSQLNFFFNLPAVATLSLLFFTGRICLNLVLKHKWNYSQ